MVITLNTFLFAAGYKVTAFTAVAARMGSSDTIHVEVSERRVLDVWVRLYEQITWTRLDFDVATSWSFDGLLFLKLI